MRVFSKLFIEGKSKENIIMCQRFLGIMLFFTGIISASFEVPANRSNLFVPGPRGKTVIQVSNEGGLGWIDISNKTAISATGTTGHPITLMNYEKPNHPSYILGTGINMSTRKLLFRGTKHIACYYTNGPQVDCDKVVNIIYYYPHHNGLYSGRYNDLELV